MMRVTHLKFQFETVMYIIYDTNNNKEGYRSSGEGRCKGDIQTGYVYLK